jgi:nucleotide-binding universal stress UspA family protein
VLHENKMQLHPKKILLPVDFSPSSDAALATATEFAQHFQSRLVLLNIVPLIPIISADEFSSCYFPQQEFLEEAKRKASERLAACTHHLAGMGVQATPLVEVGNDVVGNIMMVIEREHIDMVVISTHGISGWKPTIFGSIAEKVVRLAECPILLLRSAKVG